MEQSELLEDVAPAPIAEITLPQLPAHTPWGLWATLGFTLLIVLMFFVVQIGLLIIMTVMELQHNQAADPETISMSIATSGNFISLATCASSIACSILTLFFIRLRKMASIKEYLGLQAVSGKDSFRWLGAILILEAILITISIAFDRPEVTAFLKDAYVSVDTPLFLWIAIVVIGPIFEEVVFRGFLFSGLEASVVGPIGAIVLTSLAWAGIHLQYDLFDLTSIFVLGILLGTAKVKTGSLYITSGMHMLVNFLAMVSVTYYLW